jgi:hypothetical protein
MLGRDKESRGYSRLNDRGPSMSKFDQTGSKHLNLTDRALATTHLPITKPCVTILERCTSLALRQA